jgi:hypothetical protein
VPVKPSFAVGSYAVLRRASRGPQTMMMGDLVLRDEEVPQIMSRLLERGLQVTAMSRGSSTCTSGRTTTP